MPCDFSNNCQLHSVLVLMDLATQCPNPASCAAGTYSANGKNYLGSGACQPCNTGSYSSSGASSCSPCTAAAGSFCAAGSSSAAGSLCPVGHFCAGGASNKQNAAERFLVQRAGFERLFEQRTPPLSARVRTPAAVTYPRYDHAQPLCPASLALCLCGFLFLFMRFLSCG